MFLFLRLILKIILQSKIVVFLLRLFSSPYLQYKQRMFVKKQQHTLALKQTREQEKYENNYIQNRHKVGFYSPTCLFFPWYETATSRNLRLYTAIKFNSVMHLRKTILKLNLIEGQGKTSKKDLNRFRF